MSSCVATINFRREILIRRSSSVKWKNLDNSSYISTRLRYNGVIGQVEFLGSILLIGKDSYVVLPLKQYTSHFEWVCFKMFALVHEIQYDCFHHTRVLVLCPPHTCLPVRNVRVRVRVWHLGMRLVKSGHETSF